MSEIITKPSEEAVSTMAIVEPATKESSDALKIGDNLYLRSFAPVKGKSVSVAVIVDGVVACTVASFTPSAKTGLFPLVSVQVMSCDSYDGKPLNDKPVEVR